jgi:hypothetical protein
LLVRACAETVTVVPPVAGRVRYASTEDLPAADLCPIAPEHADTVFEFVPSLTASVPASVLRMNPMNVLDPVRVTVTCVPGDGDAPPSCVSVYPPTPVLTTCGPDTEQLPGRVL